MRESHNEESVSAGELHHPTTRYRWAHRQPTTPTRLPTDMVFLPNSRLPLNPT